MIFLSRCTHVGEKKPTFKKSLPCNCEIFAKFGFQGTAVALIVPNIARALQWASFNFQGSEEREKTANNRFKNKDKYSKQQQQ